MLGQLDILAAYDGSGGIALRGLQGGTVGDTEADEGGIAQLHVVNAFEVGQGLLVVALLGSGGGVGRYFIDESVGVTVDESDTLFFGFGCDEHDDVQSVPVGDGFIVFEIYVEGEVGNDGSVDAALLTALAEVLESVLIEDVEIAHQDEGDVDGRAHVLQLLEELSQAHAAAKGAGGG